MIVDITTSSDSDFLRSFVYQDLNGTGVDLRGTKLEMMGRIHAEDANVAFDLSTVNGLITLDAYGGQFGNFTVWIPVTTLAIMAPTEYAHSLICTWPTSGIRTEIWHGKLIHSVGPTRA